MNFSEVINILERASPFELNRIRCAIDKMLDDPKKLSAIKKQLKIGTEISYFDDDKNKLTFATLLGFKRTRASVRNISDNEIWNIPLYNINIANIDTDIHTSNIRPGTLTKNSLKVGDRVGWSSVKCNEDMFGIIIKLNPKTAKIQHIDDEIWTVPYSLLFPVMDGSKENVSGLLLEGELL